MIAVDYNGPTTTLDVLTAVGWHRDRGDLVEADGTRHRQMTVTDANALLRRRGLMQTVNSPHEYCACGYERTEWCCEVARYIDAKAVRP